MILNDRDIERLRGINKELLVIFVAALQEIPHEIHIPRYGGLRTKEDQAKLVAKGRSKTMNSYHLTGKAFDIYVLDDKGQPTWGKKYHYKYEEVAKHFIKVANEYGVKLTWGGHWKSFVDRPHFQIE